MTDEICGYQRVRFVGDSEKPEPIGGPCIFTVGEHPRGSDGQLAHRDEEWRKRKLARMTKRAARQGTYT